MPGFFFPNKVFGLNTEIYSVNLRIQSACRKIRTRKNSVFRHFPRSATNADKRNWFGEDLCIMHCINCICISFDHYVDALLIIEKSFLFLSVYCLSCFSCHAIDAATCNKTQITQDCGPQTACATISYDYKTFTKGKKRTVFGKFCYPSNEPCDFQCRSAEDIGYRNCKVMCICFELLLKFWYSYVLFCERKVYCEFFFLHIF